MKKLAVVLVGAFALASGAALANDIEAQKGGVEMNDADMDKVVAGAVLVIGNQDSPGDRSYHSANATVNNGNARRFWVITHNWGGYDNGPLGTLP
jgi:hypothetical protein